MTEQTDSALKTRRGMKVFDENPFFPSITVKSKRITNKRGDMSLIDNSDGSIVTNIAGFYEVKEVDSAQFIKLFVNGVKALAQLSPAGTKAFELMYLEMQDNIGKDKIYLSFTTLDHRQHQLSERTFRRGVSELVEKGFLAPKIEVSWYWVNPSYIWNGDRLAFIQEYIKVSDWQINKGTI